MSRTEDDHTDKVGVPVGSSGSRRSARESWASTPGSRRSMLGNKRKDTRPELEVRRRLHSRGLRYRVDHAPLQGLRRRADVVFTARRIAVFIDGCFWHGCPEHATQPKRNDGYWSAKLRANIDRDRDTDRRLAGAGWQVLRYWEHHGPDDVADQIENAWREATVVR